jgi:hypothetical protein
MKETVNYYFAIREQLAELEAFEKESRKAWKEKKRNKVISEVDDDSSEEEYKDGESPGMDFGTTEPISIDPK